jgi:hypothetical protein
MATKIMSNYTKFIYLFGLDIKCYENYTIFEKCIEMFEKYKFEIFSNYKHKDR